MKKIQIVKRVLQLRTSNVFWYFVHNSLENQVKINNDTVNAKLFHVTKCINYYMKIGYSCKQNNCDTAEQFGGYANLVYF